MSSKDKFVEKQLDSVVEYFAGGRHAFVACDNETVLDRIVRTLDTALAQKPIATIGAGKAADLKSFAEAVVGSCHQLLSHISSRLPKGSGSLAMHLRETERIFRANGCQGYIVINHVDRVIELQNTFEVEAHFREVMQFHDDVAIIWLGTREAIIAMHQSDDRSICHIEFSGSNVTFNDSPVITTPEGVGKPARRGHNLPAHPKAAKCLATFVIYKPDLVKMERC